MKVINAWICKIKDNSVIPIFGDLEIEERKIVKIEIRQFDLLNLRTSENSETIDAKGRVITIPNVNFHDHIYSRLAKGLDIKGDMSNFPNILKNLWWKLDSLLDLEMIEASAKIAALESIQNGVTYIVDHHSSPNFAKDSLRTISKTLEDFNLRNVLCFETTDRNGKELSENGFNENINFLKNYTTVNSKSLLGLHASFTLDDDSLKNASKLIIENNWGIHVHLCEDKSDVDLSQEKYSAKPMRRFEKNNLLNDKSILAHGIHLDEEDFELIKNSKASLVFNLDSNMNNSVGLQKFKMIPKEIPILIGTDGMHADVARSFKELFLQLRNAGLSFDDSFSFMIKTYFDQNNFIKKFFPDFTNLQLFERADFIIWDYVPPTPLNQNNFWSHYIYGIIERPIKTVMQNGEILLDEFKFKNVNESKILNGIYSHGERLFKKFNEEK
ncbi:MAG: amidohydrolase family protein [Ignavibacteriales bacterium]|nr:amidohydrolase family protein [Ignavibacteriales bacterium]